MTGNGELGFPLGGERQELKRRPAELKCAEM
jgi:hypothetical protein